MDLGGITLRFMVATWHAPGKVIVYIPEIKALILSDSLGFRFPGRGVFPMFLVNYADYMATPERLEKLNPAIFRSRAPGSGYGERSAASLSRSP